jgi:hypothetical protein
MIDIYHECIVINGNPIDKRSLLYEYEQRQKREIQAIKNIQSYPHGAINTDKVLEKLEKLIGPVRLLITSEDSREVLIQHNTLTGTPNNIYQTQVAIFNREK